MKLTLPRRGWFQCKTVRAIALLLVMGTACERAGARPSQDVARTTLPRIQMIEQQDSVVIAATRALEQGRPWQASRILAPRLERPATRTPAVLLRAAEAAAGWEGWGRVIELLQNESWLDQEFGGSGNLLVAKAALSLSPRTPATDSLALVHALRAIRSIDAAASKTSGGGRPDSKLAGNLGLAETLAARAFERTNQLDSARKHYERASVMLPEVREWLSLRAIRLIDRPALRQAEYKRIVGNAALSHIGFVEASARERTGDDAAAAQMFESNSDFTNAFRLRFATASDSVQRARVRESAVDFLKTSTSPTHARGVIQLLGPGNATEDLVIARVASRFGPLARAAGGYARALGAGLGNDSDRYGYADVLFRLGKPADAAAQFALVKRTSALAGAASYQRARSLLRAGQGSAARAALATTRKDFSTDTVAAASALYLLGDLESDAARDAQARRYFRELAKQYPTSSFAPQASFRAALILFVDGQYADAAKEFDALSILYPEHSEAVAARYWAGKAWKYSPSAAGTRQNSQRDSTARLRWRDVISTNPTSYYAMLAARQLGSTGWSPAVVGQLAEQSVVGTDANRNSENRDMQSFADIDSAMVRMELLTQLGMDDEAKLEQDVLLASTRSNADSSKDSINRILATALAFEESGQASSAISLARRALDLGATPDTALLRLLYPVTQDDIIIAESKARKIDPALVAAIIRQESNFTPHATSVAGARGLMQVMPSVGAALARSSGFDDWNSVLLYQPDVNIPLGVRHLASSLSRHSHPAFALAAYNAGESRVKRWTSKRGGNDPELFVERIPYTETRDYVRIVLRNIEFYKSLYDWSR